MRMPIWITIVAAIAGFAIVLLIGNVILQPNLPLIVSADFDDAIITPNADGEGDITRFAYELARNATISLTLASEDGQEFIFRQDEQRIAGEYEVLFSGVVDGFVLPDEDIFGTVERRLMPDGDYTWTLTAIGEDGEAVEATGMLTIQDADSPLPIMSIFEVGPDTFSPNQDGIDDRVEINVYLEKEANLTVFLLNEDNARIPISARREGRLPGEAGRHVFDYEGGIDLGADPPEDGTYTLVALAQDDEGQRIRRETDVTIETGGKPLAEISPQNIGVDVVFDVQQYDEAYFTERDQQGELVAIPDDPADLAVTTITMPIGDLLVFRVTVENYSDVPIRTTGPPPGTVYQQDQLAATLGWFEESGAWRIGIQCESSPNSYPYRWAIGSPDDLIREEDPDNDNVYYYLPAGEQSVVWGAIRMTDLEENNNPQNCWAGLIHEDVAISIWNNNVGMREVELVEP